MEIFNIELKELEEYPDYFAGSDGIIYSNRPIGKSKVGKLHPLKPGKSANNNYAHVQIKNRDGKFSTKDTHPLICKAFHGPKPSPKYWVAHLDGNSHNNKPSNLAWKTPSENHKDKLLHGTHDRGTNNSRALINDDQLKEIRNLLIEGKLTHKAIGERFSVSRVFITKIANGHRYPHKEF